MVINGYIRNGVVVLPSDASLPEGAAVAVVYHGPAQPAGEKPAPARAPFPLIRSARPSSINLTNERIAELLDEHAVSP
jgi:hypothetical protein